MSAQPDHLTAAEIKRRTRALIRGARDEGLDPVGVEIDTRGKIRVLDKEAIPSDDNEEEEWV